MNKQRVYYYILYGLLLGGIAAKLIGWISLTHNFFFDWVSEGMVMLFLLLEVKSIFKYFNPGVKIQQALRLEDSIFVAESNQGWLFVGIMVRIIGIAFFVLMGFLFLNVFRNTEFLFAAMCFYVAAILLAGIFMYLLRNPYMLLIDEKGVKAYFFSFKEVSWENLEKISLKQKWVALQPKSRAVNEIEFENLNCKKEELVDILRNQATQRQIPFRDDSKEFVLEK
jgi:hypothetical protein